MGVERVLPAELHQRHPEAVYVKSEVPADAGDEWGWTRADGELDAFAAQGKGRVGEASPGSAQPGDPKIRCWVTVPDDDGSLLATGADTRRPSTGVAHLPSIATLPSVRGPGFGAAVTARPTGGILDEGAAIVTLGLYAENSAARRLDGRLGFSPRIAYSSGRFLDTSDTEEPRP